MRVHEGRRDELADGVEFLGGGGGQGRFDGDDAAVADADVVVAPSVRQGAVAQDQVKHRARLQEVRQGR